MEGKDVRRRLVQRTLFPQMDQTSTKEAENCDGDRGEEVAEEEEWCASSKKGRESKKKGNSKPKKTPGAASKKAIENGKETSSKQVDDSDPQVPVKSSFFVKYSERQQQKRQQNQLAFVDSPEENDEICSPPSSAENGRSTPQKLKRQRNSTPRKERRNLTPNKRMKSGRRALCYGQIPSEFAEDDQPLRIIPNLRLEAKLTAEENLRMFAGRQIHPFFAAWKGGKTSQDLTDTESKRSSFERKEKGITFNPIHVFENVGDDHCNLDWGHWIFSERSAIGHQECGDSPVYEGSVDSLSFDNFLNVPRITRKSLYQNCQWTSVPQKVVSAELPDRPECSQAISSLLLDDKRVICSEEQKDLAMLPIDIENGHKTEKIDLFTGASCGEDFSSGLQDKLHQERIISHYHACHNQPENCLWTDKYRPQNAKQICGNVESTKLLSEWLQLWHKRGSLTARSCMDADNSVVQVTDHDYQQNDSDYDTNNDEESLKNVLLITGPVGSGKSAAIYACARDQGFQIIEINASDWRNGALIKQKFGEAVESHWLQRTVENGAYSDNRTISKFYGAVNAQPHCSDNDVIELIILSNKKDSEEAVAWPQISVSGENSTSNYQDGIKTLILFEDVDANLCEDHGFITTIQHLAETAKRPMILTSNSSNPPLPKNLDRSELSFSLPSVEELLGLVHMICASEKAKIHPCLVERFVDYCQQDIRKTIMLLQFWCQGRSLKRGNESNATHWPVLFDLDAAHHILPKVIHWCYPSKLSELVAEEVLKSLNLMEETHRCTNKGDFRNGYIEEDIHMHNAKPDPFEAKKEAMLSMQGSLDEFECAQFEANPELCDFFCSPVASARRRGRRKNCAVLSSDSEDEISGGNMHLLSAGADVNSGVLDMKNVPISYCFSTDMDINVEVLGMKEAPISHSFPTEIHPSGSIFPPEVDKVEHHCQLQERVDYSHAEDTCKSNDVSRVPESSFVPETDIINGTELYSTTVSYGHFGDARGTSNLIHDEDLTSILESALGLQSEKSLHVLQKDQETLGNNSDINTAHVYREEVGDSLSKSEPNVLRGYLDECSRVDFTWGLKSLNNTEADLATDFVKDTWKRLHEQCNDLNQYVTAEEKTACQVLTLAHGMNNLISEADLLLKDCQTIASDSLRSSMIPSEKIQSCSYHDDQLEMSSILAQHGMCFYAKEIVSLGPIIGSPDSLNLASEMLLSSSSSVALGKLVSQHQMKFNRSDTRTTKDLNILTRKSESGLSNILQTIVPSKSYLAVKGDAFHEYISTLSQISRLETSRMSECIDNRKRRRAQVSRHYLSSGSLALSAEEISLLSRHNSLP